MMNEFAVNITRVSLQENIVANTNICRKTAMPADTDMAQKVTHGSDWSSRCQPTLMWHRR